MRAESEYRRQGGFSLIEVIVAIVMLGLIFGGFATVYATVFHEAAEPQLEAQALSVAEGYLSEVTSRPYLDPDTNGLCGGVEANRTLFDNVCDYNGLASNGYTRPPPPARRSAVRLRPATARRSTG